MKHGRINATLPKDKAPEEVSLEEALELLAAKATKTGKGKKAAPRKTAAKKSTAKKTTAKKDGTGKTTAKKPAARKATAKKTGTNDA